MTTDQRLAEIRARAESGEPGSNTRDLGPVVLSCMDPQARDLMETALEQYRAFHARHLETIAEAWRNSPEWGGMWESIGADQAYLFAYWLFRHSGLVDARARADIPFLLDQFEAFRAAALGIQRGTYIAGIETPCASVAWDRWKALVGLIDERLSIGPPDPAPEYLDAVAALQRHCAMQGERLGRMEERLRKARVETERLTAELAALKAQEP